MSVTAPGSWRSLGAGTYTERHVEMLMPLALWGIEPERPAPLPERRSQGDGRPSDLPAELADMQNAWRFGRMDRLAKRAFFLRYVLGMKQTESAARQGISQRTAYARERAAMLAILDHLNGEKL